MADAKQAKNTDREIWRKVPGDYYSSSIHVTKDDGIGINVGGLVFVRPVVEWHGMVATIAADRKRIEEEDENHKKLILLSCEMVKANDVYLKQTVEMGKTIADQAATIERLRGALENIHDIAVGYDGYKGDVTKLQDLIDELREIARQALDEKEEVKK